MKILFTINYLTDGGPTRVLQNIIRNMNKKKYEIYVLTIIDNNSKYIVEELTSLNVKIIEFKISKNIKELFSIKNKIIEKIIELKPDIIHTHGIVTTFLANSKKIKCKKITTIHNNIYEDYRLTYGKIKGPILAYIHIKMIKKFTYVVCCSKTSYLNLKDKIKNICYIQNGVDITNDISDINVSRENLQIPSDAIVYVYGGVINKRKRVVELIELFTNNCNNNEYLLIVGDGKLKTLAEKKANKNVIFTGFKKNILDYFKISDIYISYSSSEGFSISVIEALSSGLFCFLSDIPSHKECFEIDNSIYIGEHFNASNFIEKKDILVKKIKNVDNNTKSFQEKYLSSKVMAKKYCDLYNRLRGD